MYRRLVLNSMQIVLMRSQQRKQSPAILSLNLTGLNRFSTNKIVENVEQQQKQSNGEQQVSSSSSQQPSITKTRIEQSPPPKKEDKGKNKRKTRKFKRPKPKSLDGQTMYCTPLAESIEFEKLERNSVFNQQFDVKNVSLTIDRESEPPIAIRCQPRKLKIFSNMDMADDVDAKGQPIIREFYVFKDGVVVFWNIDPPTRDQIIGHLEKCATNLVNSDLRRSEEEFMNVEFSRSARSNVGKNVIYLDRDLHLNAANFNYYSSFNESETVQERFAFSHAMAASVRLSILEENLCDLEDEKLEKCIEKMKNGKLVWKVKEAMEMIGKIAHIRHILNTTDLLDKDIYWDLHNSERLYNSLASNLNLINRRNSLNEKINYCENFSKIVHEMLNQRYSHRLEWYIIALIAIEVVFFFYDKDKLLECWEWLKGKCQNGIWAKKEQIKTKTPPDPEDEFRITLGDRLLTLPIYPVLLAILFIVLLPDLRVYRQKLRLIYKRGFRPKPKKPKQKEGPDPDLDD